MPEKIAPHVHSCHLSAPHDVPCVCRCGAIEPDGAAYGQWVKPPSVWLVGAETTKHHPDSPHAPSEKSARHWFIRKSIFGRWTPLDVVGEVVKAVLWVGLLWIVLKRFGV